MKPLVMVTEKYSNFIENYDLKEENIENNLTFEDVYKIAREIIESIDEKYLPIYDKILNDGTLEFNYNSNGKVSYCNKNIIKINRKFSYDDVHVLVHEFMHYTNVNKKQSINFHLFCEFIAIYFELYACNYINKYYDNNYLYLERFLSCKEHARIMSFYLIPFYVYLNSGNLNENSCEFVNRFFIEIDKNDFEHDCMQILKNCEKKEQSYQKEILYEKEFNEEKFGEYLVDKLGFDAHYRYFLGTLLAYYAIDNVDIKNMVALNDFINTEESAQMSPIDLLYKFGIDIDEFLDKSLEIIEKILEDKKKMR